MKPFLIAIGLIAFMYCAQAQPYHPFQNFDDDVDRIKTYSNFFGGDFGIVNGDSTQKVTMPL